jgi:ABC-type transporter Mla maintaining outer membrane lipid asymmetry ATPase subunit MlaF
MTCEKGQQDPSKCTCGSNCSCHKDPATEPPRREVVIEVEGLTVERSRSLVVDNASFNIHKGDYVGMVGPNGGGKTTILKAILGTIPTKSSGRTIVWPPEFPSLNTPIAGVQSGS